MNRYQIDIETWAKHETGNPLPLATYPRSIEDVEAQLGTTLERYWEDGLGEHAVCFFRVDKLEFLIKGLTNDKTGSRICVEMHANERQPMRILEAVEHVLGLSRSEATEVTNYVNGPEFSLVRSDDNGNEAEVDRFHIKEDAETHAGRYRAKGHKQMYWVRRVT